MQAIATLTTGDDLLYHYPVADLHLPTRGAFIPDIDYSTDELVPRYYRWFAIRRATCVAPEHRGPLEAFDVTRAYTNGFDTDYRFAAPGSWLSDGLQSVVLRPVANYGANLAPPILISHLRAAICFGPASRRPDGRRAASA